MNLISNAIKFTSKGYVKIIFKKIEDCIQVDVQDTGIGMSQETISKLCQPFATFQNDGVNKEGIGLGLFICKKITGYISKTEDFQITSELNKGSNFSFTFLISKRERSSTLESIDERMDQTIKLRFVEISDTPFKLNKKYISRNLNQ